MLHSTGRCSQLVAAAEVGSTGLLGSPRCVRSCEPCVYCGAVLQISPVKGVHHNACLSAEQ